MLLCNFNVFIINRLTGNGLTRKLYFFIKNNLFVIIYRIFLYNLSIITFERHICHLTNSQKSSKLLAFAYMIHLYISNYKSTIAMVLRKFLTAVYSLERRSLSCTCPSKYYMTFQALSNQ